MIRNLLYRIGLLLIIPFFLPFFSFCQEGNLYITNFQMDGSYGSQNWAITQDNMNVMLFANRKGIMTFDSEEWEIIKTPDIPYSIAKEPNTGQIFVGCNEDFGYIAMNDTGNYHYFSLSENFENIGEITYIEITDNHIYFYSNQSVIRFSINNLFDFKQWVSESERPFNGIVKLNNTVYVNIESLGLHEIVGDSVLNPLNNNLFASTELLFAIPFEKDQCLIGTSDDQLFIFNGININDYSIEDEEYIYESILSAGINLSESEMALATLVGGCLIVDKATGKTNYTINYGTGLPDDEIFAIGKDNNNGLWLSHDYGVSRIDIDFPVKNYNLYPGLEGNLISMIDFNNTIYISTSDGVYYLSEVKDYQEIEVYVRATDVDQSAPTNVEELAPLAGQEDEEIDQQLSKKDLRKQKRDERKAKRLEEKEEKPEGGIISKILGLTQQTDKNILSGKQQGRDKPLYVKEKIYALQSISHVYKKVNGLDEKSKQMVKFNDRLLVATNTGLYEIKSNLAQVIVPDKYINFITSSLDNSRYYIATNEGIFSIKLNGINWVIEEDYNELEDNIYSIIEDENKYLWLGSDNLAYKVNIDPDTREISYKTYDFISDYAEPIIVKTTNNKTIFLISTGIFYYNEEKDSILLDEQLSHNFISNPFYIYSQPDMTWMYNHSEWICIKDSSLMDSLNIGFLGIFDDISEIYVDDLKNIWVIDENNTMNKVSSSGQETYLTEFGIFLKGIANNSGLKFSLSEPEVNYESSSLQFRIAAPYFIKSNTTQYQYLLESAMKNWSKWSFNTVIEFPLIPSGKYVLHIRAKNVLGAISESKANSFEIKPPFWLTTWFILLMIFVLLAGIYLLIKVRERKLQRDKRILEQKVKERTAQIQEQKEEIEVQRDGLAERNEEILQQKEEIETQRDEIEFQRDEIITQKNEITDSIEYASRIQTAILPSDKFASEIFPEHFILYKPRDIVSGDYYWMTTVDHKAIVVAADCTGHGVPGAFMSMLGVSFLNEIINKSEFSNANEVLNILRSYVKDTLSQTGEEGEASDGMDMVLCVFDNKKKELQFAGANNPLYLIRNDELIISKPDKMPIGIHVSDKESFTNNKMKIQKGDIYYIFSDGYVDQFGGKDGKKFKRYQFKELLMKIHKKPMSEQKKIMDKIFEDWKGNYDQVDDILVIGIKIT